MLNYLSSIRRFPKYNLIKNFRSIHTPVIVLCAALFLVGIWSFTLLRLEQEKQLVLQHATISQRNLAEIISQNLQRLLDSSIQYAQILGKRPDLDNNSLMENVSLLTSGDRAFNRPALFDLNGNPFSQTPEAQVSKKLLHEIKLVAKSLNENGQSEIFVAMSSGSPQDLWQVPLLLPVKDIGVLVLHLDLGYLLRQYQDIEIGRSGFIRILKPDGSEMVRARASGLEITQIAGNSIEVKVGGSRVSVLADDGITYLNYLSFSKTRPLAVEVGQALDEILLDFHTRRTKYLVSLFLLSLIIIGLTIALIAGLKRQRLYIDAILSAEKEKRDLIEQLKQEKLHALELASNDPLTGLNNRRMFMSLADSHLACAQRSGKHYALAFLDLDRFKAINDSLGHPIGDLLLQGVSERLKQHLRQSDVIARLGGDEFVILITGAENEGNLGEVVHKLVEAISKPFPNLDGHTVTVTPSIGVALFPRDAQDLDALIRHADQAMYQSKRAGRGCCTFFGGAIATDDSLSTFDLEQRMIHTDRDEP